MSELFPPDFRTGFVTIIGEPNVGKSTLLNALMGAKISIVTPKPQTTRKVVIGMFNDERAQIIFLDSPGLIKPRYALQRSMMNSALRSIEDSDVVLFMIDGEKAMRRDTIIPSGLKDLLQKAGKPVVVCLNKVDRIREKTLLLPLMQALNSELPSTTIIPMSALKNDNLSALLNELIPLLPAHPPLYPRDILSTMPERFFVSEIIREKIFFLFREEIPYSTEVIIVQYTEEDDRTVIDAEILVERESQRKILIGQDGQGIKEIGIQSRLDIQEFLDRPVRLNLHVKHRDGWRESEQWVKRLGYE